MALELDSLFDELRSAQRENLVLDEKKESFIADIDRLLLVIHQQGALEEVKATQHPEADLKPVNTEDLNRMSKKDKQAVKEATSGDKWFNMPRGNAEDPKFKRDLMIIQQRAVLDPKRHYKKDKWTIPKYFQVGTIVEDKSEFYSARLKKKERQQTLLQEILHDKESTKYFKRKYASIQEEKAKVVKYKLKRKFRK